VRLRKPPRVKKPQIALVRIGMIRRRACLSGLRSKNQDEFVFKIKSRALQIDQYFLSKVHSA
jgi:hypothetical protein